MDHLLSHWVGLLQRGLSEALKSARGNARVRARSLTLSVRGIAALILIGPGTPQFLQPGGVSETEHPKVTPHPGFVKPMFQLFLSVPGRHFLTRQRATNAIRRASHTAASSPPSAARNQDCASPVVQS